MKEAEIEVGMHYRGESGEVREVTAIGQEYRPNVYWRADQDWVEYTVTLNRNGKEKGARIGRIFIMTRTAFARWAKEGVAA
jgi:hypothetical protein